MRKKRDGSLKTLFWLLALAVCLPIILYSGGEFYNKTLSEKELLMVTESVRRAAVQCYAIEGFYPQTVEYLQDKYGVLFKDERYFIDYQYIGENLLPDITVLPINN